MRIRPSDALIIVDVQNDFCYGGALAVPGGSDVVPIVNSLLRRPSGRAFSTIVLSQDWHPAGHLSFASSHAGGSAKPFDVVQMFYGPQVLWPDHCMQGTPGAQFHPALDIHAATAIVRKGTNPQIDSYSTFRENDRKTDTGLAGYLRGRGVERVFLAGLAFDYCVRYSAVDARAFGFDPIVISGASRSIDNDGSVAATQADFATNGIEVIERLQATN